jgi:CRISPR-associated exonuclease Cas4
MVRLDWCCRIVWSVVTIFLRGDAIDIVLFIILSGIGVVFLCVAFRVRSTVNTEKSMQGIPKGVVLYSDLNVPAKPLFSQRLHLSGKPDYILQRGSRYIPVEVKTGRQQHPQQSHVLQLAAYCQLIEDTSGEFVAEGILVYNRAPYTIPFDPKLRFELEQVMSSMRTCLHEGSVERNHTEPGRCQACSMKRYCSQRLL